MRWVQPLLQPGAEDQGALDLPADVFQVQEGDGGQVQGAGESSAVREEEGCEEQ